MSTGPQEAVLIALYNALRSARAPADWAGVTRLSGSYGARLGVTAGQVAAVRDMTVGEFADAVLAERRGAG